MGAQPLRLAVVDFGKRGRACVEAVEAAYLTHDVPDAGRIISGVWARPYDLRRATMTPSRIGLRNQS